MNTESHTETVTLLPCPFCGNTPDPDTPSTFQEVDGPKWGAVVCCCHGPEVRTGYGPVDEWKANAAAEWNERVKPVTDREVLAETIHNARGTLTGDPWKDEDRRGKEYCYRIADAVLVLLAKP